MTATFASWHCLISEARPAGVLAHSATKRWARCLTIAETEACATLDEVIHPSFGLSLVALNMVRAVRISDNAIEVDMVMNYPGCPAGEVALALVCKSLAALNGRAVRLNLLPQVWAPYRSNLLDLYRLAHQFPQA